MLNTNSGLSQTNHDRRSNTLVAGLIRRANRRGSTLVVVIALMGMLALMGVLFFTFASQERENAENFLEAAKQNDDQDLGPDVYFNWALQQLISGPSPTQKNSALYGGRHSILANAFGNDSHPYTGRGVNLGASASGAPFVDQDFNGIADNPQLLNINDSPAANGRREIQVQNYPQPDVDYTYPDINNVFLSYVGYTMAKEADANGNGTADADEDLNQNGVIDVNPVPVLIVKPSFHRPELLRGTGGTWYNNASTAARSMRAHPSHVFVPPSTAAQNLPSIPRFLDNDNAADAALLTSGGFKFHRDTTGNTIDAQQGVWDITSNPTGAILRSQLHYDGDEDNDQDGIYEGIILDLDFPPQEDTANGKLYMPMFSFHVVDADGLFNLNAHGNLAGNAIGQYVPFDFTNNTGAVQRLSHSLHGLSSYEVNPIWGLTAVPGPPPAGQVTNLSLHSAYYGGNPVTRLDLANMEWWWLNKGRADATGAGTAPKIIAGRLGDADRILQMWQAAAGTPMINFNTLANTNLFPFPGIWNQDDNRDRNEGGRYDPSQPLNVSNLALAQSVQFNHPLSYGGSGQFWNSNLQQLNVIGIPNNPTQWIQYKYYQLAGDATWRSLSAGGQQLMPNAIVGSQFQAAQYAPQAAVATQLPLFDDMTEITLDHRFVRRPYDEHFTYEDTAGIQLSETDYTNTGISSRIRDLAPGNMNPGFNPQAGSIRKRFTGDSWDRKQFGLALNSGVRTWEFNHDSDQDGKWEFPPAFPGTPLMSPSNAFSATDPFRPQLRRLLAVENGNNNQFALQFRLALNQLLDVQRTGQNQGNPVTSPLEYRPLTPHPTSGVGGSIPTTTQAYPPQNADAQEYWARRDRQLMARDLYVMLATFCRGDQAGANPTLGTAYATVEQRSLLKELAQFSVNVVDALDRDNVITLFEYDLNLSNGWNLDDNPATGGALNPAMREQDRQVVVGVESQQLALSETLWVHQAKLSADNSHTPFNEMADKHQFLFTELRNLQPTSVALYEPGATVGSTTAVWRVRRSNIYDGAGSNKGKAKGKGKGKGAGQFKGNWSNSPVLPNPVTLGNVTPATMAADEAILYFKDNGANTIAAGGQFTIATGDPYLGAGWPVDLYVNRDATPTTFELVAPNAAGSSTFTFSSPPTAGTPLSKRTDLDLVVDGAGARHQVEVSTSATSSGFFDRNTAPAGGDCALILERRLNPKLPQLPIAENPWVVVDYMEVRQQDLGVVTSDDETTILSTRLPNVASIERPQPLDGDAVAEYVSAGANTNTINSTSNTQPWNSNCPPVPPSVGPKAFDIQQLHFDRDFSSAIDLFNVPLRGPQELTRSLAEALPSDPALLGRVRFLHTDTPYLGAAAAAINGNHWHRLLSFVEVPTKSHRQLGNPFQLSRVPGKVNLNTIRHAEVLGGLLDVPEHVLAPDSAAVPARYGLQSNLPGTTTNPISGLSGPRDLWADFLVARDGFDPLTRLSLPGISAQAGTNGTIRTNGSRPFRDLSFDTSAIPNGSVEHTILRGQLAQTFTNEDTNGNGVLDAGEDTNANGILDSALTADQQQPRLFDIGGATDPYVRSRLLSKIMGNSTTRSNVFFVFMTVRFHEVYEDASGNQRVGGRYDLNNNGNPDDDTHRGFFMLDRSNAEEAFNVKTGTFDWKEVVKYRLTIN